MKEHAKVVFESLLYFPKEVLVVLKDSGALCISFLSSLSVILSMAGIKRQEKSDFKERFLHLFGWCFENELVVKDHDLCTSVGEGGGFCGLH